MYAVVYEDESILVVNKPAGVSVHPPTNIIGGRVYPPANALRERVRPDKHRTESTLIQEIQKDYPAAQLAHRLDKDTSGLLLVAKNMHAYEYLKDLFKKRKIKKKYIALVTGVIAKDEGEITLPIARSKKDFRKRVATPHVTKDSRPAETRFKVLKRFPERNYTLVEVHPKTGRTHQIRSHLASIGHPVACDKLYGGKRYACPMGLTRQFLHAAGLGLSLSEGRRIILEAELPSDLHSALVQLS